MSDLFTNLGTCHISLDIIHELQDHVKTLELRLDTLHKFKGDGFYEYRDMYKDRPDLWQAITSIFHPSVPKEVLQVGLFYTLPLKSLAPHIDPDRQAGINFKITDTNSTTGFFTDSGNIEFYNYLKNDMFLVNVTKKHFVNCKDPVGRWIVSIPIFEYTYLEALDLHRRGLLLRTN